ncbi:hypothetical protein NESM_000352800 [Novymonas esmeraldas]|uniref:Uncharacterized protein n=1 Tax=Novymonas esmeraldas TaxID=1808958 RepID=A0AAW0EMH2_9TRYP
MAASSASARAAPPLPHVAEEAARCCAHPSTPLTTTAASAVEEEVDTAAGYASSAVESMLVRMTEGGEGACTSRGHPRRRPRSSRGVDEEHQHTARAERCSCAPQCGSVAPPLTTSRPFMATADAGDGEGGPAGAEAGLADAAASVPWRPSVAVEHSAPGDCLADVGRATSEPSLHMSEGEAPSATTTVTLWVPTQFTTAAGRAVCVREQRELTADSPYWRLLCFPPERHAIVASPEHDVDKHHADAALTDLEAETPHAPACPTALAATAAAAAAAAVGADVKPMTTTYVGHQWVHSRRCGRRASSCPERWNTGLHPVSAAETHAYELPSFSGFCAADGRPIYCHPHRDATAAHFDGLRDAV